MHESSRQKRIQPLALAVTVAFTGLIVGCAAETTNQAEPPVVIEGPQVEMAKPVVKQEPLTVKMPVEVQEPAPQVFAKTPTSAAPPVSTKVSERSGGQDFWQDMDALSESHGYENGIRWRLLASGIELQDATIEGHRVDDKVIQKIWADYGEIIEHWSAHYQVPIEIIITTICVESRGNPRARNAKNFGLMQVLVPTARGALNDPSITEESLYDPSIAIRAGTAYIASQRKATRYDPPKVAAAYNAGSLRSAANRWGMRQYGPHLDKTVLWFNAVLAFVASEIEAPRVSFANYFQAQPKAVAARPRSAQ